MKRAGNTESRSRVVTLGLLSRGTAGDAGALVNADHMTIGAPTQSFATLINSAYTTPRHRTTGLQSDKKGCSTESRYYRGRWWVV